MKRISKNYKKSRLFESEEELKVPDDEKLWQAYGEDMTKAAEEGGIEEVIGRDKELEQLLSILKRKTKDNPVLVGEPGVGKTAIVDKLALLMASDKRPGFLAGKKLIDLTWAFKKIVKAGLLPLLAREIEEDNLIIFVDELHSLPKESYDELKPFLAKAKLHMIGGSTYSEYGQTIEKDGAMERRFQPIKVEEPTYEECMEILRKIQEKYEDWHHVNYSPEALESFYKLSKQYMKDRFLPDKAIDLMDESGARIHIKNAPDARVANLEKKNLELLDRIVQKTAEGDYDAAADLSDEKDKIEAQLKTMAAKGQMGPKITVTKEMVEKLVADKTGIPVETMKKGSKAILKGMSARMKTVVIGQDEAVETVVRTIKRNRSGLKDPNRPEGVFLFVGPTGTGKTYLVKKLAEELFGSKGEGSKGSKLIRIDMSEYAEAHTGSKLFGSPPGYVGYSEGGKLTEQVRRNPYSVILLDEIEKAHPQVIQSLVGVLDDGRMTDGQGRTVDFTNCVIVMTSNVGSKKESKKVKSNEPRKPIGFSMVKDEPEDETKQTGAESPEEIKARVDAANKKVFSPEFINRIDDIVIFKSIDQESIKKIAEKELEKVADRIKNTQDINLTWGTSVYKLLLKHGFDPEYGARPLRRAVTEYILDPLANYIIEEEIEEGSNLKIDYDSLADELVINGKKISELSESRLRKIHKSFSLFESTSPRRINSFSEFSDGLDEAETEREKEEEKGKPAPLPKPLPKRKPQPTPQPTPKPEEEEDYEDEEDEDFDPDEDPDAEPVRRITPNPGRIKVPSHAPGPQARKKKASEMDVIKRYMSELKRRKPFY